MPSSKGLLTVGAPRTSSSHRAIGHVTFVGMACRRLGAIFLDPPARFGKVMRGGYLTNQVRRKKTPDIIEFLHSLPWQPPCAFLEMHT